MATPQWSQPRTGWMTPLVFTQMGPVPLPQWSRLQPQWSRPRIGRMTIETNVRIEPDPLPQ